MKLRLFGLRHVPTGRPVTDLHFPDKPAARKERDKRNAAEPNAYCVTFGPDHRHYKAK
jgi:hypothetical protein